MARKSGKLNWIVYAVALAVMAVVVGVWIKTMDNTPTTRPTLPSVPSSPTPSVVLPTISESYQSPCGALPPIPPVDAIPRLVRKELTVPWRKLCRKCD